MPMRHLLSRLTPDWPGLYEGGRRSMSYLRDYLSQFHTPLRQEAVKPEQLRRLRYRLLDDPPLRPSTAVFTDLRGLFGGTGTLQQFQVFALAERRRLLAFLDRAV